MRQPSLKILASEEKSTTTKTPLNSFRQDKSWQRPRIEIRHVKKLIHRQAKILISRQRQYIHNYGDHERESYKNDNNNNNSKDLTFPWHCAADCMSNYSNQTPQSGIQWCRPLSQELHFRYKLMVNCTKSTACSQTQNLETINSYCQLSRLRQLILMLKSRRSVTFHTDIEERAS